MRGTENLPVTEVTWKEAGDYFQALGKRFMDKGVTEEQARLFAPFTRLHQVRAEGHGLGLSIVQRIAERLGR